MHRERFNYIWSVYNYRQISFYEIYILMILSRSFKKQQTNKFNEQWKLKKKKKKYMTIKSEEGR